MKINHYFIKYLFFITTLLIVLLPMIVYADISKCSSVKYSSPSSDKNNIIFTFDKYYQCGQFANGDWWVTVDSSQQVIIKSISPNSKNMMNGVEKNPSSKYKQGFDYRLSGYDSSLNLRFPMPVSGETSIVKVVSISSNKSKCRPCLQFAAVLSIVKSPIDNSKNVLRPGYFGSKKTYYSFSDDMVKKLPKYPRKFIINAKKWTFDRVSKRYAGVQLDHLEGWVSRFMHPADNMPDYGASIATDNAVSILRLLLDDFDFTKKEHKLALIGYLQMAVDLQAMAANGVTWPANGGHGNGRKLPILFAGYMLNESIFYESMAQSSFSEDNQIYKSKQNGRALFGVKCTASEYWKKILTKNGKKDCRDPYEFIDGGHDIGGAYQYCCTAKPWKYTALVVSLLGLKQKWNNDAFFDYVERWVKHGAWTKPDSCAKYNGIPEDMNIKFGGNNSCILGGGRFIELHGKGKDGGYYDSKFGDKMWLYYKK